MVCRIARIVCLYLSWQADSAEIRRHPEATIYNFSSEGIEQVAYTDTEHYRVTRDFLLRPQRMLDVLLDRSDRREEAEDD